MFVEISFQELALLFLYTDFTLKVNFQEKKKTDPNEGKEKTEDEGGALLLKGTRSPRELTDFWLNRR